MKLETTGVFKELYKTNPNLHVLTDEEIKKIQMIELEMLVDILDICNQYNIGYHLTGGTALGVIRHKGFIPWDDDIDIDMDRIGVELFLREFTRKYGEKYWIHTPYTKGVHCCTIIHIRKKGTIFQSSGDPTPEECGVCVDILPIENTYDNPILRGIHGVVSTGLGLVCSCRRFYMNRIYLLDMVKGNTEAEKIFRTKIMIGKFTAFFSLERWIRFYDKWNAQCHNTNTKYVVVATGKEHFFKGTYERAQFSDYQYGTFELLEVKIPKDIDGYLSHMFGNYMEIPPVEKRERHVLVRLKL